MGSKPRLTDPSNAIRLYRGGLSLQETAAQLGVSWYVVFAALKRAGVPRRDNSGPKLKRRTAVPDESALVGRYLSGVSEKQLAHDCGVGRFVIRRILTAHGVACRNRSQGMYTRMEQLSPTGRAELTEAAHAAARGRIISDAEQHRHAIGRARALSHVVPVESELAEWLRADGMDVSQQFAVGAYNLDIAVHTPAIAVEVFGGNWHASGHHAMRHPKRTKYLLDLGWSVVIVWVDGRRYPLRPAVSQYIIALVDELRHNPPARGQYRVILGDGQDAPVRRAYLNDAATIEALGCNG